MADDKQWEYARLERTTDPKATDPGITVTYTAPDHKRGTSLHPSERFDFALAELGRKGWELVGAVSASPQDEGRPVEYIFKRPHDAGRRIFD